MALAWNMTLILVRYLLSKSQDILLTNDRDMLIVYDIKAQQVIKKIKTLGQIYKMHLSNDKKTLYIANTIEFQSYNLKNIKNITSQFNVRNKERVESFFVSNDKKYIYLNSKQGVKVLDIQDKLNPKITQIYSNPSRSPVSTLATSIDQHTLYIGFTTPSLARVKL